MLGSLRTRPQDYVVKVTATLGKPEHHGAGLLLTQDGYFVSTYHIANDILARKSMDTTQLHITYDGHDYPLDPRVDITYQPAKDLFLAKADIRGPPRPTNIKLAEPNVGEPIKLYSKPGGRNYHSTGKVLSTDCNTRTECGLLQGQMLTSAPSFKGCSGGIYADERNAIVGMVAFSSNRNSGGPKSSDIERLIDETMKKYR